MTSLSRELVFLILQFLDEEKFKESVHKWDFLFNFFFFVHVFTIKLIWFLFWLINANDVYVFD